MPDTANYQVPDWLAEVLASSSPDIKAAIGRLADEYGCAKSEARKLFYDVTLSLNKRFFPPLSKMELTVTEQCNLACTYCFETGMKSPKRMGASTAKKAVDLLFDHAKDGADLFITFFGGEPLLNMPVVEETVAYSNKRGNKTGHRLNFQMTSNGTLIDDSLAKHLSGLGIRVLVSLDGMGPTNDENRRYKSGKGSFDEIAKGIQALKPHQPWIGVKMTVTPSNALELFENVMGLRDLGINQFIIGHATGMNWSIDKQDVFERQLSQLKTWYLKSKPENFRIAEFDEPDEKQGFFGCSAARSTIAVSVDGAVSPCSKILGIESERLIAKLGSVDEGLYCLANRRDVLSCAQLAEFCREIGIADTYRGGCVASNYTDTGDLFSPSMADYEISQVWARVGAIN